MKYLAWDTSSKRGVLVAFETDSKSSSPRILAEMVLDVSSSSHAGSQSLPPAHSQRLLWAIHQLLEAADWKIQEIDGFGIGLGPGSFTGIRIGLTTARSLAETLKKPLLGVSSLQAQIWPAVSFYQTQPVYCILTRDACKGEWFSYAGFPGGPFLERVSSAADLLEETQKILSSHEHSQARWLWVGETTPFQEGWSKLPQERQENSAPLWNLPLQPYSLMERVADGYAKQKEKTAREVLPQYCRVSDAEKRLLLNLTSQ